MRRDDWDVLSDREKEAKVKSIKDSIKSFFVLLALAIMASFIGYHFGARVLALCVVAFFILVFLFIICVETKDNLKPLFWLRKEKKGWGVYPQDMV